ncbi:TonB-dependent receptor [Caulobacter segnis]|uniref:TonB-dependent receptor n=1 Tax=Caulobacter segnis TaxID=88688 RepID=A0A2W5V0T7_9CAUL|nr:TonB-dependent receptor [Caulobacter segnis]PZR31483.1 MAG: TonB-dependent receptor [Caulobacter segnis]
MRIAREGRRPMDLVVGASILALIAAGGARAEDDPAHAATHAATQAVVDEVVVTAFKREERLQTVGATITALSAQSLRASRVAGLTDLSSYAPNVDIKETVPGALPTVTMRGIGLDDFSTTSSPAAGVYIDEVPLSSPGLMSGDFLDLARIEALKGPQGTLYGRNTTAGALNIISAKPEKDFAALAKVGYGAYRAFDAEGMINLPLSDTAQLRLSAKTIQQARGYWTSTLQEDGTPGERDIGSRDVWLGRVQLALQPIQALSINLKVEGQRSRSEIGVPQHFGAFTPGAPFAPCAPVLAGHVDNSQCADAFGYRNIHKSPYRGDWAGAFPYSVDQINATSLIQYDLGGFDLTSVTGYINFARFYHIDVDATPRQQFDYLENEAVRQFTQEFRVGKDTAVVDLLGGAFVSWDHVLGDNTNLSDQWPLVLFGAASGSGKTTYNQTTRSAALYANGTWHLRDDLDLITGVRYTGEERHYAGGTRFITPSPLVGVSNTFIDDKIHDHNVTWKLGLNWRIDPRTMVYGSAARGVKSGGFFSGFSNNNAQLLPYRPETLTAYELGAKTQPASGLTLNGALFYYDYSDPQTFVRYTDPATSLSVQKVGNVDSAKAYGAEFDASWRPLTGLTLNAGLGLLHTKLSSFSTAAGTIPAGNRLPNAPKVTFNGSARYEWALFNGLTAALQGEAHYAGAVFKEAANDPLIAADSYWLFNARATVARPDDHWELAVWGKNLTDKLYEVQGNNLSSLGLIDKNYNTPRTYGVELTYRY